MLVTASLKNRRKNPKPSLAKGFQKVLLLICLEPQLCRFNTAVFIHPPLHNNLNVGRPPKAQFQKEADSITVNFVSRFILIEHYTFLKFTGQVTKYWACNSMLLYGCFCMKHISVTVNEDR